MKGSITVGLIGLAMAVLGSVSAQVTQITVQNFSFEIPSLPNVGDIQGNVIPDWDTLGDVGLYYPSQAQYSGTNMPGPTNLAAIGIPDGKQVAYSRLGFITQNVAGLHVQAGFQYNLTVDVGQRLDVPIDHYTIALEEAGTNFVFAQTSAPTPDKGFFTGDPNSPTHPRSPVASFIGNKQTEGLGVKIVLFANNPEANFDNVRLTEVMGSNDLLNDFVSKPTASAGSFQMVFKGDVRNNIDAAATAKDELINPYAYADSHFGQGLGTASVSLSLDNNGNTVVTFSGPRAIQPTDTFFGNGLPHFGVDGIAVSADGTVLHAVSQKWLAGMTQPDLPAITLLGPTPTGQITDFATVYANVNVGGLTVGEWFEVPLTLDGQQLCFINDTGMSETLSDIGIYLSPNLIPLDRLNFAFLPPPGEPGSPFTSLSWLNGITLRPGDKAVFNAVPEPGAIFSFGALFTAGGVIFCLRRRRAPGHPPSPPGSRSQ